MRRKFAEIYKYQRMDAICEDEGTGYEGIRRIEERLVEGKPFDGLLEAFFLGYIQGKRADRARRKKRSYREIETELPDGVEIEYKVDDITIKVIPKKGA